MSFARLSFALALALGVGLGCAPGRMADLRDTGRLSVGLSMGLGADVRLGDLSHPALGVAHSGAMVGFESRDIDGIWYEAGIADPFAIPWYRREGASWRHVFVSSGWRGIWETPGWMHAMRAIDDPIDQEPLPETGQMWLGEVLHGNVVIRRWIPIQGGPRDLAPRTSFNGATDLQAGATLLLVGARVGVNPLEILDLLLGFAGQDIAGDDPK